MSQKKIFLVLVAISTVSLLLHHGGHLNWTMESFSCSSLPLGIWRFSSSVSGGSGKGALSISGKPKHTSLVFLKTHKTASTTVQNIIFRFAERHNLTVALPVPACSHQFCYPQAFSSRFVHPHTIPPHILTSHTRMDAAELRRLMPNGTRYITILREPTAMFESLFSYYNQHCLSFRRVPNGSLEEFLSRPQLYYRAEEKDSMYARNTATFDLGGDKDHMPVGDTEYARAFATHLEGIFSLVMIAEHFDESLVLLRRLLHWEPEDVLYLKLNMRTAESRLRLRDQLPAQIRAWNWLDSALYDHFNATLWRRLEEDVGLGCVEREVRLLRKARDWLVRECFGEATPPLRAASQIRNKELRPWQPSSKVAIVGYDLPFNGTGSIWENSGGVGGSPSQGGGGAGKERGAARGRRGVVGGSEGSRIKGGITKDMCMKMVMPEVQYSQLLLRSQLIKYRYTHPHPPPH